MKKKLKQIKCRNCGKIVSSHAKRCRYCGTVLRMSAVGVMIIIVVIIFIIAIIAIGIIQT